MLLLLVGLGVVVLLSEISFAAARTARMQALAQKGDRRAARFLGLRAESGKVVTASQVCLNAVGVLGGIVGDGLFGPGLSRLLAGAGLGTWSGPATSALGFCLVTAAAQCPRRWRGAGRAAPWTRPG